MKPFGPEFFRHLAHNAPSGPEFGGVRVKTIAFGDTEFGWVQVPSKPRRGCPADGSGP
jgi:hypothetical protein